MCFSGRSLTVEKQVSSRWMFVFVEFVVCRRADLGPIYNISFEQNQMFLSSCSETCDCKARCQQSKTAHTDICHINFAVFHQT